VEFGSAFPADGEAFELVEQGEGLLDDVAELAQALVRRERSRALPMSDTDESVSAHGDTHCP
jgi:hypothetical protein